MFHRIFFVYLQAQTTQTIKTVTDTTSINARQDEIIEEFEGLDDWMDRYGLIIEKGNDLPPLDDRLKTADRLIEGCQSRVWLDARYNPETGRITFNADSDALIVKGIISMLVEVLSDHTPDEILNTDLYFIDRIGLSENLSPTRSNGLVSMLKQLKAYALAYKAKQLENQ